jgi:hypothetical protein
MNVEKYLHHFLHIFQTKHNNYDCSQCPGVSIQCFIKLLNTFHNKDVVSKASGYIN